MQKLARLAFVPILAAAAFGCGGPATFPQTQMSHPLLNQPLPNLKTRSTLDGAPVDPDSLKGKPIVIKFFADYCAPCKDTLPAAQRVHAKYDDVVFIGVSEDEDREAAQKVVQQFGLTFKVVYDDSKRFAGMFRVNEMPRTFVADKNGVVRWIGGEGQTESELKQAVEAAR
jgi:thiol-disulfide isomerase/thioredoxin